MTDSKPLMTPTRWAILGCGSLFIIAAIVLAVVFSMWVSYNNAEVGIRKTIEAKQKDNENVYDNFWKKLKEISGIPDKERETAKALFVDYAAARTPGGEGKLMKFVKEAVPPTVTPDLYKQLMNTVTNSRDDWVANQRRLLDLNRERNVLIESMPQKWFITNTTPIDVVIVTSTRTAEAFRTGKDDEILITPPTPKTLEK